MYVVILAGGSGTRLWPRSRQSRPKQLLDIVGQHTMLQKTVMRIQPLVPAERILIMTGQEYAEMVQEQLPELPRENIVAEPSARGTAPCSGLAAVRLEYLAGDDVIVQLHADAHIEKEEVFRDVIGVAAQVADEGHLVTVGIVPRSPDTGLGYIQRGDVLRTYRVGPHRAEHTAYRVRRFAEKPDAATAVQFVQSGEYYWNSGIFAWRISRILAEFERCEPRLYAQLREIQASFGTPDEMAATRRIWETIQPQSIDVGVMEKAEDVAVVPADIGWSDVGNWQSLAEILAPGGQENVVLGQGSPLLADTSGSLIYSGNRLVAALGLENMVIVDTEDVILICPKERAQDVKKLVDRLRQEGRTRYL